MKSIKDKLYFLTIWWRKMTAYPTRTLTSASASDYEAYWDKKRGSDLSKLSAWQKARADIVIQFLKGSKEPLSIGDIGSGPGAILGYVAKQLPVQHAIGYEVSTVCIAHIQSLGFEGVRLHATKPEELQQLKQVDYNFLFEIIEHVPHAEELVRAALATARKGVFISIPNSGFFPYRLRLLFFGKMPMQWTVTPDEHLRFWTLKDMEWWLAALSYTDACIWPYQGVPVLNRVWPSLFAAGLVVFIPKAGNSQA